MATAIVQSVSLTPTCGKCKSDPDMRTCVDPDMRRDVPAKARAAVEWCKSASSKQAKWQYLYVPEEVFQRYRGDSIAELARACEPTLHALTHEREAAEAMPLFAGKEADWERAGEAQGIVDQKILDALPERLRKAADEAISLYRFFEKKPDVNYAPVFTALLGAVDELAKRAIVQKLSPAMPANMVEQRRWFEPHLGGVDPRTIRHYEEVARNLRKTLVYQSGVSPLGLLRNCLDYALNDHAKLTGVFDAVRTAYRFKGSRELFDTVNSINDFRNTRVAHQEEKIGTPTEAKAALVRWINGISRLWQVGVV
jgi:type III restriction enzyme